MTSSSIFTTGKASPVKIDSSKDALPEEKIARQAAKKARNLALSFWIALILTLPLVVAMFADIFGVHANWVMFLHEPIVQLILATPVQFVIGWRFYVGAYHALRNKSANSVDSV